MPGRYWLLSKAMPPSVSTSATGLIAPSAAIITPVPTSKTCMMSGAWPARKAAMPAFSVSG